MMGTFRGTGLRRYEHLMPHPATMSLRLFACLLAALLAGCAGMRLLEIDVRSLSTLSSPDLAEGTSYRFERLLSQDARPQAQAELEAIVERALAASPLRRAADPLLARYSLAISARTLAYVQDDEGRLAPIGHGQAQISVGSGGFTGSARHAWPWMVVTYLYRSEITLVLRDLRSMKIVYESRALHEGPWPDRATLYANMFEAALRDFPNPPAGVRRVRVEIPR